MKKLLSMTVVLVLAMGVFGCGEKKDTDDMTRDAQKQAGSMDKPSSMPAMGGGDILNKKCPITGEAIDPKVTVDFNGKKVAFCCKDCIAKWNDLNPADKLAKIK